MLFAYRKEFDVRILPADVALRILQHADQGDDIKLLRHTLLDILEIADHQRDIVQITVPAGVDPAAPE